MSLTRCAAGVLLVIPLVASRRVNSFGGSTLSAAGQRKSASGSTSAAEKADPLSLRVFSATYNAGNHIFSKPEAAGGLLDIIIDGHDIPGQEADILMLGIQEFQDKATAVGEEARTRHLWGRQSKQNMEQLRQRVIADADPPEFVREAKRRLATGFLHFHQIMDMHLEHFRGNFGAEGEEFHRDLVAHSPLTPLSKQAREMVKTMREQLRKELQKHQELQQHDIDQRFRQLLDGANRLEEVLSGFPATSGIRSILAPLQEWTDATLQRIGRLRATYPNLDYTISGEADWRTFLAEINNTELVEGNITAAARKQQEAFMANLTHFAKGVKTAVVDKETEVSMVLVQDMINITQAVHRLSDDLTELVEGGRREEDIAQLAIRGAMKAEENMSYILGNWSNLTESNLEELLQPNPFSNKNEDINVLMAPQKFDAGWRCAAGAHYDAMLYIYVNPWSSWKFTAIPYESPTCKPREVKGSHENPGCSINNNEGWECGKVVNFLMLNASREGKSLRVCGMNTHMSFKGTAEHRMEMIYAAMVEAQNASCDTVFFMGDFNSRLHCEVPKRWERDGKEGLPAYEKLDPATNSSMKSIVDTYCSNTECLLGTESEPEKLYTDELAQMMAYDTVSCYELDKSNSEQVWRKYKINNKVRRTGVREAALPRFSPTYKLASPKKASTYPPEWVKCLDGEPSCFLNKDAKGKHNMAWTDRILVQSSPNVKELRTTEYSRRTISPDYGSDHLPVIAIAEVEV